MSSSILVNNNKSTYSIEVPGIARDKRGHVDSVVFTRIDFSDVYVATPNDTAAKMNAKLNRGVKAIVFTPGVYTLEDAIRVTKDGTVLYGLGLATLVRGGTADSCVQINALNVRVAGLLFEAGSNDNPSSKPLLHVEKSGRVKS